MDGTQYKWQEAVIKAAKVTRDLLFILAAVSTILHH